MGPNLLRVWAVPLFFLTLTCSSLFLLLLRSLQRDYVLFTSPFIVLRFPTVIVSSYILTPEGPCSFCTRNLSVLKIQRFLCNLHARRKFVSICWIPSHVGLSGNVLAKKAIQLPPANHNASLLQNYVPSIRRSIRASWQSLGTSVLQMAISWLSDDDDDVKSVILSRRKK